MNQLKKGDLIGKNRSARIYSSELGSLSDRMAYARSILEDKQVPQKYRNAAETFLLEEEQAYLRKEEQAYFDHCLALILENPLYLKEVKPQNFRNDYSYRLLAERAISIDPSAIIYVDLEHISEERYYRFCYRSIEIKPKTIRDIDPEKINDKEKYLQLCKRAVEVQPSIIQEIKPAVLSEQSYYDLCKQAIVAEPSLLKNGFAHLSENAYYNLCLMSIQLDAAMLASVKAGQLANNYKSLCEEAIAYNPQTIRYLNRSLLSDEDYYDLYKKTTNKAPSLLKYFISASYKDKEQYSELCTQAIALQPDVIQDINPRFLAQSEHYEELCRHSVEQKPLLCMQISNNVEFTSGPKFEQIYTKAFSQIDPDSITAEQYSALCERCIAQNAFLITDVKPDRLKSKEDYEKLCLTASRMASPAIFPLIDHLDAKIVKHIFDEAVKQKNWELVNLLCEISEIPSYFK